MRLITTSVAAQQAVLIADTEKPIISLRIYYNTAIFISAGDAAAAAIRLFTKCIVNPI